MRRRLRRWPLLLAVLAPLAAGGQPGAQCLGNGRILLGKRVQVSFAQSPQIGVTRCRRIFRPQLPADEAHFAEVTVLADAGQFLHAAADVLQRGDLRAQMAMQQRQRPEFARAAQPLGARAAVRRSGRSS